MGYTVISNQDFGKSKLNLVEDDFGKVTINFYSYDKKAQRFVTGILNELDKEAKKKNITNFSVIQSANSFEITVLPGNYHKSRFLTLLVRITVPIVYNYNY